MTVLKRYTGSAWETVGTVSNPPACRVYNSAAQTVADATPIALTFDSERYDTNSMHSTSSNTNRITINTAGLYVVGGGVTFLTGTDYTSLFIGVRLNGATYIAQDARSGNNDGALNSISCAISTTYKFSAADYVELLVWQNNTGGTARSVIAGNYSPEFHATWVGTG